MKRCPGCNIEYPPFAGFCVKCGQPLKDDSPYVNDTEYLLKVAYYYREGRNVNQNKALAAGLYRKVLDKEPDNVRALYGLHWCHHNEADPNQNINVWFPLVKQAAELGYPEAQVILAGHYCNAAQDKKSLASYKDAVEWYEKAIEKDNTKAMKALALLILGCDDASKEDQQKAISCLEKGYSMEPKAFAADLGEAFYSAKCEELRDFQKAMRYFKEAAVSGDGPSACKVGQMYELGKGTDADVYNAVSWYHLAAYHNNKEATVRLGQLSGGSEKDNVKCGFSTDDTLLYLDQASNYSGTYAFELMEAYESGRYGMIDQRKAEYYCRKYGDVRARANEQDLNPDKANAVLFNKRQLRELNYAEAVTKWHLTSDSNVEEKKEIIKLFERNIEQNSDLLSLKTLAAILIGDSGRHRLDLQNRNRVTGVEDPVINSIPEVVDIKRAFELLEKGVAWGDQDCARMISYYCSKAGS